MDDDWSMMDGDWLMMVDDWSMMDGDWSMTFDDWSMMDGDWSMMIPSSSSSSDRSTWSVIIY